MVAPAPSARRRAFPHAAELNISPRWGLFHTGRCSAVLRNRRDELQLNKRHLVSPSPLNGERAGVRGESFAKAMILPVLGGECPPHLSLPSPLPPGAERGCLCPPVGYPAVPAVTRPTTTARWFMPSIPTSADHIQRAAKLSSQACSLLGQFSSRRRQAEPPALTRRRTDRYIPRPGSTFTHQSQRKCSALPCHLACRDARLLLR